MEEKLGLAYTVKRALILVGGNISLLVFAFLCSLPLLCFLVFFEFSLQNSVSLLFEILYRRDEFFSESETSRALSSGLIQTCLLYFFPYQLLDLFTMAAVVAASSSVYTSEEQMGLGRLVRRLVEIGRTRFVGCLITSLFILLLSTSVFFGFISAAANYYLCASLLGDYRHAGVLFYLVLFLVHGSVFVFLMAKFNKWSVGWNMGLVVSVLEDEEEGITVYGSRALSLSAFYSRGHERQSLWLMLVFSANALVLRLPCFHSKCSEIRIGVLYTCVYACLICVGNVFKWVACVVFYHESRTQVLEKTADLEVGAKS